MDPNYRKFQFLCSQFQNANLGNLNNTERTAFFINAYNLLALHSYIEFPRLAKKKTMIFRLSFFKKAVYNISGCNFNLWDFDHACLRACSSSPTGHFSSTLLPKFKSGDPRFIYRITTPNPFVNFALNPATPVSPPIKIYTRENFHEQLIANFQQFAVDHIQLEEHKKSFNNSSTKNITMVL